VEWAELALQGGGEAWRTRVIVARLDPRRVRFDVQWGVDSAARSTWSAGEHGSDIVFAVNAGQFTAALPWGWVVADGRERLSPGRGPLSSAFVSVRDGSVRFVDNDTLDAVRRTPGVVAAFQSYPTLLRGDGDVPPMIREPCAIDCAHRDARIALGIDRAGRVLVALTRFDAAGEALGFIPLGLTVPETAALMGALGARQAVLLDGGISAQMLVRDAAGAAHIWRGVRRVPLGLVARVR
jgi:exopolysaccharide biosynthesis protein